MKLGAILLASCSAFIVTQAIAQTTSSENGNGSIETVVVTASKRAEKVKDVPSALTVLDSSTLENLAIHDFSDYVGLVPNLDQRSDGSPGEGAVVIRGMNTGPQQTTNTTGFYLDTTPFSASSALSIGSLMTPDPDLTDVDSIEVLKGPQSTLYGANAIGGIVIIHSKQPDLENYSGMASINGSAIQNGGMGYGLRGSVNIPIIDDELGIRIAAYDRHDGGFTTDLYTGGKNSNIDSFKGFRASVLWEPTSRLRVSVTGLYQSIKAQGSAAEDEIPGTTTPLYGNYEYASSRILGQFHSDYDVLDAEISYDTGFGTLTNSASWAAYTAYVLEDLSLEYDPYITFLPNYANYAIPTAVPPSMQKKTDELRFTSTRIDNFQFTGGLFYTHEFDTYFFSAHVENAAGMPPPPPYDSILGNFGTSRIASTYDEYAAYGDLTYYITDDLDIGGGYRYSSYYNFSKAFSSGLIYGAGGPGTEKSYGHSDNYLATLRWRITEDLSSYLRVASGYRPGGPETNPITMLNQPYGPDSVWNYEGGAKGTLLNGKLDFDFDVYHIVWKHIQLNGLLDGFEFTENAGVAHIDGTELDMHYRPIDGLLLGAGLGYNDARLLSVPTDVTESLGAEVGDRLPLSPLWNGSATADYSFPVGHGYVADVGMTFKFHGSDPSSYSGPSLNVDTKIPSYETVDLRSSLSFDNYLLQFIITNVANKDYVNTYAINDVFSGQGLPGQATVGQPRTFSLWFTANF